MPPTDHSAAVVPDAARLAQAFAATRAATRRTPLIEAEGLARQCGAARLFVKAEGLQRTGSFKLRGAMWRLMQLSGEERKRGVVAFSSGNFAQGLAAAGRDLGIPVTIVMPIDAPEPKRRATEGFGARLILSDHGTRPREAVAAQMAVDIAAAEGLVLLHPFDDPDVVAGQGAVGLEALEQLAEAGARPDVVVCPVGGGGLMGGVALALRAAHSQARIYGVEPEGFDGMGRSLRAGDRITAPGGPTVCDALQAMRPGAATFAACHQAGVVGLTIADAPVAQAMAQAFEVLKLVLEPSGAVALAAVLSGALPVAGCSVLVVTSGGNIAFDRFSRIIADHAAPAAVGH